ncbi:MAG: imidazole glycerol phosphate synthase subunit HisF [Clostridiales bacterium]|nr:imidazole glycerol phosphate synthase subunit HisF [Clostridiales bacterium]
MAAEKRIIPCLDIKDGKVVKGVNFVDLVDVGDPVEIACRYEEQGADEVVFLDITATHEGRDTIYSLVEHAAKRLSIPLTLGGGIRNASDFRKALDCGAFKVSINSAAAANPDLIKEISEGFGKHRLVVAIDGKKTGDGYRVFTKGGREDAGFDLVEYAKKCEELGAGEILLTSMDGDGTQDGYDVAMTKAVCEAVNIPVVASGGCGKVSDIIDVFKQTDCDAALAASLFHYGMATVSEVKREMERNGIPCRKSRG